MRDWIIRGRIDRRTLLTLAGALLSVAVASTLPCSAQNWVVLYVADPGREQIVEYELSPWSETGSSSPPLTELSGIALDNQSHTAYALHRPAGGNWTISSVDLATHTVSGTVIGSGLVDPKRIEINPDFNSLYVADASLGLLRVPLPNGPASTVVSPPSALAGAHGVALNAAATTAYVVHGSTLSAVDLSSGSTTAIVHSLGQARDVAIDPYERFAFVVDSASASLIRVYLDSGCVETIFTATGSPAPDLQGVSIHSFGIVVYITDRAGRVWEVNTVTYGASELSAGAAPTSPVDSDAARHLFTYSHPPYRTRVPAGIDVSVPINLSNITGLGVTDIHLVLVDFPSGMAFATSVERGTLTADPAQCPTFIGQTGGTVEVDVSCVAPLSGEGSIAVVNYQFFPGVFGGVGLFPTTELNGGAIWVLDYTGGLLVQNDLFGRITHWLQGLPVEDVTLSVSELGTGESHCEGTTRFGDYVLGPLTSGSDYLVVPYKNGYFCNGIDIVDALQAAQIQAGMFTPNADQLIAGDVTGSSHVTVLDAFQMARFAAGVSTRMPVGQWLDNDWFFRPNLAQVYPPTTANIQDPDPHHGLNGSVEYINFAPQQFDQDYIGGLYGDVDGDWRVCSDPLADPHGPVAGGPPSCPVAQVDPLHYMTATCLDEVDSITFSFPQMGGDEGADIEVPLTVTETDGSGGISIVMEYDAAVLAAVDVARTTLTSDWEMVANLSTPGEIRIGAFGSPDPLSGEGELITIEFAVVGGNGGESPLHLAQAEVNEGAIGAELSDGSFCVGDDPASEVQNLRMGRDEEMGGAIVSWDALPFTASYNAYRGTEFDFSDLICLESTSATSAVDDDTIGSGQLHFYLVSGVNCSGEGGLGFSGDWPRPAPPGCG